MLGLVSAAMVAVSPAGEGIDGLLADDEADVRGQVRDAEGNLVEDAVVSYPEGGISDATGASGWYFLEGVETGEVQLTMEAEGYKTVERTVHLERGNYNVDFLAEPGEGTVQVPGVVRPDAGDAGERTWLMALGLALASVFALVGAAGAYLHRWYPLVVVGCLLGILSWGWFVGSAIAVVALVIVLPLRGQFGPEDIVSELPWHEPPPPDMDVPDDEDGSGETERVIDVRSSAPGAKGPGGMPPGRS